MSPGNQETAKTSCSPGNELRIMPLMPREPTRLRDLSKEQVRSGFAAWLGWLFDGLDMHLYTLVATPFVTTLLGFSGPLSDEARNAVDSRSSIIQAAFLVGWALGGAFF